MLRNYLIIMLRNVARQRVYSIITILGLTIGITFAILIGAFVGTELQVNQDIKDVDRLYLVETEYQRGEGSLLPFFVPAMLGQRAMEAHPALFENCYRFRDRAITVSNGDKHHRIQSMIGDSTLLSVFGFKVVHGDQRNALLAPDAIVVTERVAKIFFGKSEVVGESLAVSTENNGLQSYVVTAVIEDLQDKNSVSDFMNMNAEVFLSHANRANFNLGGIDDWGAYIITYIKLTPSSSPESGKVALNNLLTAEAPLDMKEGRSIKLTPLSNYYLLTNHGAVAKLLLSLAVITIFILLLAVVNFVNITIARSLVRLREVGVRSVMGGVRKQVLLQFLSEAMIFVMAAAMISLVAFELLRDYFSSVVDTALPSVTRFSPGLLLSVILGTLVTGLLAGAYPAFYLSAARTTELLKGKFKSVTGPVRLSRVLIEIQFVAAVVIFTASLIMSKQISHFMEADLGYDKSRVMIVSSVPRLWNEDGFSKMDAAKSEFLSSPHVAGVSLSWGAPNFNFSPYSARINHSGSPIDEGLLAILAANDEDYADVYSLTMAEGKFLFNRGEPRSPNHVVLNESAAKGLQVGLGDKLRIEYSDQEFTVVGIVEDFNFESFHKPIQPVVFIHTRDFQAFRYFSFELPPGDLQASVDAVRTIWKRVFPGDPFDYQFTDDRMGVVYKTELQLKKAAVIGSVLILTIVLTGVFSLVSLSLSRRTREIGIRKVLGASVSRILALVGKEYVLLLLVACLAGIPASYVFGWWWLGSFAYRIDLQWWMFALPGALLTGLTIGTVVIQSLEISAVNPVESLRHE